MNCTERLMTSLKNTCCVQCLTYLTKQMSKPMKPLYSVCFTIKPIPYNSYPPISSPSRLAACSFLLTWDIALTEAELTDGACSRNCHAIVGDQSHIKGGKGKDLQTQADCKRWGPEIPHKRQYESLVPWLRYFKVQPRKSAVVMWGYVMINHFYFF